MSNYHARARAKSSLTAYLTDIGWPIRERYTITAFHSLHIRCVKQWSQHVFHSIKCEFPFWSRCVGSRAQIVEKAPENLSKRLMNVQRFDREYDLSRLQDLRHTNIMQCARSGVDMVRIPLCLHYATPHDNEQCKHLTFGFCKTWAKDCGLARPARSRQVLDDMQTPRRPISMPSGRGLLLHDICRLQLPDVPIPARIPINDFLSLGLGLQPRDSCHMCRQGSDCELGHDQ